MFKPIDSFAAALLLLFGPASGLVSAAAFSNHLADGFQNPPESAKPLLIWQWMNGVVSKQGITADLESFKRIGIGGVQNFQIGGPDQALADDPSVQIGNDKWCELMRFTMDECARLGLSFGTHNCPGWSSSASPEVKVEDSMQKLVWTETTVSGNFSGLLPQAPVDSKWNYYRDIAVLAVPDRAVISKDDVVNLTGKMDASGRLVWNAPPGTWRVLRFGHTTTGNTNAGQSPASGVGLECDKFSRAAVERFWQGYPSMLLDLAGKNAGTSFQRLEIDSYEAGAQDWTPAMLDEFKKRRGYDLLPWLPALAGKTIASKGETSRFKHDWKQTIADLFADNYYLFMDELARRTPGLEMLVEPYGTGHGASFDTASVSGGESLLACEFWTRPDWGWDTPARVASAAHTWGKPLVLAEAFTCWPLSAWQDDPYALKGPGDRAFAEGVNRMMLHAGAQNPWPQMKPGLSMGIWGTQFVPGQTWWEHGGAQWISYLSRCQFLLQQGLPVADLCYFLENKPASRPAGYAGDACGERVLLTRMSVQNGRLVLPDGMSYRVLVLPKGQAMTLPVAQKLRQLVSDGAIVLGEKPVHSPSLEGYPDVDAEMKKIGDEVWGDCDGKSVTEHCFGKGKVFWGKSLPDVLKEIGMEPDVEFDNAAGIKWTHRHAGGTDIYFVCNQNPKAVELTASFRVSGRVPELWHPDTGKMAPAANWQNSGDHTAVLLDFDPTGSAFVVFRHPAKGTAPGLQKAPAPQIATLNVKGPWQVRFHAGWGAPDKITLDKLVSWSENPDPGVKFFSGTATYENEITVPAEFLAPGRTVELTLGEVKNIAEVFVNDQPCGILWKPPFRTDLTHALKPGQNKLEIRITNLWPNRMIGDEQQPDDCEWSEPIHFAAAKGKPIIGRMLAQIPDWLIQNKPRPSKGRYTFVSFKFFTKDSPLLTSGLLGPVTLEIISEPSTSVQKTDW